MWLLLRLRLPSVISLWNIWIFCTFYVALTLHYTLAAEVTTVSSTSTSRIPLFQEILLIHGSQEGDHYTEKKNHLPIFLQTNEPFSQEISNTTDTDIDTTPVADDDIEPEDLVQFVTQLEKQAQDEEKSGWLPEILGILGGAHSLDNFYMSSSTTEQTNPYNKTDFPNWELEGKYLDEEEEYLLENTTTSLPVDLSDITEDIVEQIAEGVEESLRLSDDVDTREDSVSNQNETMETRQLSVYLFQGQYIPEPRLNRFIDGAIRNMGTEMRIAVMDPLYFRVLPRGRVEIREKPIQPIVKVNINRRPVIKKVVQGRKRRMVQRQRPVRFPGATNNILVRRRRQKQRRQQIQRRKQQQKRKQQRIRQQQQKQKQRRKQIQNQQKRQRIRRRIIQDVGGGRVEGLSRVYRDGDAEMQLFGNYTLIRSHMKMGPVELSMQFRTQRGIRRTGATLPVLRVHSVTRVNQDGSEMIDFLLDRPHPETIKIRGKLFPLAERIAKNIFARLFLPESFLVQRVREKTGLALLSKPTQK